jgi:hypothetical protein
MTLSLGTPHALLCLMLQCSTRGGISRQVFGVPNCCLDVQESRLETAKTTKIFFACGGLSLRRRLRRAETVFTVGNFLVHIFVAPP